MDNLNVVVEKIVKRFPVYQVWLFGSQAKREKIDPTHDVDIAVIFDDCFHMVHRELALATMFHTTGYNVDVVLFNRKQFEALLKTAKRTSIIEENPWEPSQPSNPLYQFAIGKLLYSKSKGEANG